MLSPRSLPNSARFSLLRVVLAHRPAVATGIDETAFGTGAISDVAIIVRHRLPLGFPKHVEAEPASFANALEEDRQAALAVPGEPAAFVAAGISHDDQAVAEGAGGLARQAQGEPVRVVDVPVAEIVGHVVRRAAGRNRDLQGLLENLDLPLRSDFKVAAYGSFLRIDDAGRADVAASNAVDVLSHRFERGEMRQDFLLEKIP